MPTQSKRSKRVDYDDDAFLEAIECTYEGSCDDSFHGAFEYYWNYISSLNHEGRKQAIKENWDTFIYALHDNRKTKFVTWAQIDKYIPKDKEEEALSWYFVN